MAKDKMRTLEEVIAGLSPESRARVEKRTAEISKSVERHEEHRRVSGKTSKAARKSKD